jgi:hypothetical protein
MLKQPLACEEIKEGITNTTEPKDGHHNEDCSWVINTIPSFDFLVETNEANNGEWQNQHTVEDGVSSFQIKQSCNVTMWHIQ